MTTASNLCETVKSKFLQLGLGGTMTTNNVLRRNVDNSHLDIFGGTQYLHGAHLTLRGKDKDTEAGTFVLSAIVDTANASLVGHPNGNLTWKGNTVVCVESWKSGNKWYRKYSDGWIEQGGNCVTSNPTLSFNIAFSDTNYNIVGSENQGDDNARAIKFNRDHAKTTSIRMVGSANPICVCWYACGY